ncbi:MAG: response regulator [Proteobacteria bacterium]|nr:response regulator [Pseudomonadota bacterium]MCH9000335.1 response regulator [Pseudomonadota bacterium]
MARILIIDDEDELRSMLRRMLEQAGHEVTEAVNGAEGIELYERDRPDLIITDIIMPEKEGVETIIALRRADPDLPIIAISGGGRLEATDFLTMARKLGARRTLAKPFRRDQLLEAVDECLAKDEA